MIATNLTEPADPLPDLQRLHILDAGIGEAILGNRSQEAIRIASEHVAAALNDLAAARIAEGSGEEGIRLFREALRMCPGSQSVFHNLTAVLLARRSLRNEELTTIQQHLLSRCATDSWTRAYRRLLFLPNFLNLEFVSGRCNLQCRMCLGGSGDKTGRKFAYLPAEDFRMALEAAPTITGLTLSSGDSDPLLHPEFERVVDIACQHRVALDVFTNGLALTARMCRKIVMSKTVGKVNFSLDAATEETYRRIRGAEFGRVLKKIEMLRQMKEETDSEFPRISLSFVAMTDNISELPDFVDLAGRIGANRVYVEDLIGWDDDGGPNRPATENPACTSFVEEARRRAAAAGLILELPKRLSRKPSTMPRGENSTQATPIAAGQEARPDKPPTCLRCCGWINGVWVQQDGRLDPCCLVHDVADLGNVRDGPLLANDKFARLKGLLFEGRVFPQCAGQRMCQYVQQQEAAGRPLRFISERELGRPAPVGDSESAAHASLAYQPEPAAVLAAR